MIPRSWWGYIAVGVAVLALAWAVDAYRTGKTVEALDELRTTSDSLRARVNRSEAILADAASRVALADSVAAAVRDSVALVRASARAEQSRASQAISELRGRVAAAASDSASVVALVDSIQTEHEAEVAAVRAEVVALEVRVESLEASDSAKSVALRRALATVAESSAESAVLRQERDGWRAAFEDARDPPLLVSLSRGSKWVAVGMVIGYGLAR